MNHNIKYRPSRTKILYWFLPLFLVVFFADRAFSDNIDQVVLMHVKSIKTNKEFMLQAITTTSLEALKLRKKAIIFFDVEAVKAVKIGRWYGGDTTILDKVRIKDDQRKKLSNELNISLASLPSNYGELFRLLRGKGVDLYFNEAVMKALNIEDEGYDLAFTPINNDKIAEIFLNSDVYISY